MRGKINTQTVWCLAGVMWCSVLGPFARSLGQYLHAPPVLVDVARASLLCGSIVLLVLAIRQMMHRRAG
jgi:hypothetical protein